MQSARGEMRSKTDARCEELKENVRIRGKNVLKAPGEIQRECSLSECITPNFFPCPWKKSIYFIFIFGGGGS